MLVRICTGYTVGMVFHLTRRQKLFFGIFCFLLVCLVFAPQVASAQLVDGILRVISAVVGGLAKGLEWILGLFQYLFLEIIKFTILDFAKNWQDGGFLSDFRVVWQVLRDFVNLIIVVFFVITAVMTVFGDNRFGFHKKGLLFLILAAVFVNFSAFFTLLFIDLSHILFMLFFNALDASSWGSFSPFSGYSVVLGDVGTGMFNIIVGVIAAVVNWFIILGILYFCIILIERYIIAMFLVLLSPLAALGFFTSIAGGNPLAKKFSGIWEQWWERLGYVFTMPVVLILGFTLLLVLFQGALGQTVDPDNFVKLLGLGSEGRGILLQLIMASIVLILGIFKVGEIAKKANIHPALAGKFKLGEFMSGRAQSLWKGKPFVGAKRFISEKLPKGAGGTLADKFINRTPRIARTVFGAADAATKVGRVFKGAAGGTKRAAQDVDDVLRGRPKDAQSVRKRAQREVERTRLKKDREGKAAKRVVRRESIASSTKVRESVRSALYEENPDERSKKVVELLQGPMKKSISGGEWATLLRTVREGGFTTAEVDMYKEMASNTSVPAVVIADLNKKIQHAIQGKINGDPNAAPSQSVQQLRDMVVSIADNKATPVDVHTSLLGDEDAGIRQKAVESFVERIRTASPDKQKGLINEVCNIGWGVV